MRLLEGSFTLYTSLSVRVSRIKAKLVCLSITSKQAKVAPECCQVVQGWKWRCPLTEVKAALLLDEVTKDYKLLLKSGPREFEKSLQDWNYENRLLLYRGKIYIPHSMEDTLQ